MLWQGVGVRWSSRFKVYRVAVRILGLGLRAVRVSTGLSRTSALQIWSRLWTVPPWILGSGLRRFRVKVWRTGARS